MSSITELKCPKCGAPMRFDPGSGLFLCDNCGNWEDPKDLSQGSGSQAGKPSQADQSSQTGKPSQTGQSSQDGKPSQAGQPSAASKKEEEEVGFEAAPSDLSGLDMNELLEHVTDSDAADLPVYNCVSCGAEVIAPPEQVALTCPYCRNNIVLTDKVSGKLRPDGVIPFKIQSKDLPAAVRRFYRGKKLLPRRFFSEATMGKVTGVYVPFWVFSGKMSGRLYYRGVIAKTRRSGDYVITDTKYYSLVRDAALDFKDLPVDAGTKMDDRIMDSLEPFDTREAQAFDMRYLAGFTADRFDQTDKDLSERARGRMTSSVQSLTFSQAANGYSKADPRGHSLNADLNARYLLFPVYMFDIYHRGQKYHFAVNGQTGKVVGDLPVDSSVSFSYFLTHAGVVSAAILAFNIIMYLTGH